MPHKSRWTVPLPTVSLPTFFFGSPTTPLGDGLAYADADDPTISMTWSTFRLWSQRFAAGLRAAGLKQGDRVMLSSANDILYPVVFTGIIMAGGIYTSANARFVPRELAYQLEATTSKFMLVSDANLSVGLEAAKMVGMSRDKIFLFNDAPLRTEGGSEGSVSEGVRHWKNLLASKEIGSRFEWRELSPQETKSTTVALIFSSGTTGLPKGVEITHYNFIANAVQTDYVMSLDPQLCNHEYSSERSRWLCVLPMYHGLALCYYTTISIFRRIPTYMMKQFDLNYMLDHIQRYRITELHLVPPIVVGMAKHPGIKSGKHDISSVTKTFSIAAPLGAEVSSQYDQLWPNGRMNVKQGLGMSESCCNIIGWDPNLEATSGSVGEPMPNCEILLMDDNEKEVAQGERGEVWVRCPNIMKGYWNNRKATEECITSDGWLKTGDVAYEDQKGYYYVVDRKKEFIKVRGVQVAPAELEALLLDHPGVIDVAVIGVKDGEDEAPRAYIVPNPMARPTEAEILRYMEDTASSIKRLTGGVVFTHSIPKTPAGKILRRLVRDMAGKESKL